MCWGANGNGQLGDGTTDDSSTPVEVLTDTDPDPDVESLVPLTGITAVATGGFHSCALASDTTVWCWGSNVFGQLGDDTNDSHAVAIHVQVDDDPDEDVPASGVTAITAGRDHTCGVDSTGAMGCWGRNDDGQLGDGTNDEQDLPVAVEQSSPPAGFEAITAGDNHTCARRTDGRVDCWGANDAGQLGDGSTSSTDSPGTVTNMGPTPSEIPAMLRPVVKSLSASGSDTCLTLIDTSVYCWGDNATGIIGDGVEPSRLNPVAVQGLAGPL